MVTIPAAAAETVDGTRDDPGWAMRRRGAWAVGLAAAVALGLGVAGCADDDGTSAGGDPATTAPTGGPSAGAMPVNGGLDVAAARATAGGTILVRAFLFVDRDGAARLCDAVRESYPPGCGGASMPVSGLAPELVAGLQEQDGTRWSDGPVQLLGAVRDGVFVNDPAALAAG